MNEPRLFPRPKSIQCASTTCPTPTRIEHDTAPDLPPEGYRLRIRKGSCRAASADAAGAFYAERTMEQIRQWCGDSVPELEIEDAPDYPVRGLYHDVTRGKVPTLATLCQLADRCAAFKLNQLQLYIEHTYAFEAFPEVWENADPLTADEIRALDAHCRERHIELVPSFTTFGHFYPFIHTKRFQHLNELERDVSDEPFNWKDRMGHYTLDCRNPESAALVETLIREVRPLFSSDKFNLCADETFDLGKGKNREAAAGQGVGRLYLDFVNQTIRVIKDCGATPMMWADIVGKHPELVDELEPGVILLDWAYAADLTGSNGELMQRSGRPFYVCSGTSSWNTFIPDYSNATRNIKALAADGHARGAVGHMVTDWGDFGHICPLALSYPGIALAGACSWNLAETAADAGEQEEALSFLLFHDAKGRLCSLLHEVGDATFSIWRSLAFWQQPRSVDMPDDWFDAESVLPDMFFRKSAADHADALARLRPLRQEAEDLLNQCAPPSPEDAGDIRFALRAAECAHQLGLFLLDRAGRNPEAIPCKAAAAIARDLAELDERFEKVWLARNKRSEFDEIRKVLRNILRDIEGTDK
mgnify:CR=1 FL=1